MCSGVKAHIEKLMTLQELPIKHTCGHCGYKYQFTAEQRQYSNYATYCPSCHWSLGIQSFINHKLMAHIDKK